MPLCLLLLSLPLAAQNWEILFDGRRTDAFRTATTDTFPSSSWEVRDGLLQTIPGPLFAQDLWTRNTYRDFELLFEWRVEANGNSGVKYLIQDWLHGRQVNGRPVVGKPHQPLSRDTLTPSDGAFEYTIGYEYQIIDEQTLPASMGPIQRTGALYGFLPPTKAAGTRPGIFHQSRLTVQGDNVEHWLDGVLVLAYAIHGPQWEAAFANVDRSAVRLLHDLARRDTPIALQHHSSRVAFRNIRVRRLSGTR